MSIRGSTPADRGVQAALRAAGDRPDGSPDTSNGSGWIDFRIGRQAAFNGFRGVGIITFILYHGQALYRGTDALPFLSGAFLWLEMFFVQSGFLIISLLLEEHYRTGRIRLGAFYARRALRLFPALLVVCCVVAVWVTFEA